jgi:chromatin assembly factor 1 subunit B
MKVETPQILWNAESEKGKNAPLLSIDMVESGLADPISTSTTAEFSHVLVTAGNATSINLWKVNFGGRKDDDNEYEASNKISNMVIGCDGIYHKPTRPRNDISYMLSLTRHDVAVNAVAFSPDGLHLATAGDSGNIVVWSVPVHKRGNNNGRHFWSTLTKENELTVRIVSTHCEGIVDLSWSSDSKRFVVGTIDSCLLIYEDKNFGMNACNPETHQKESEWSQVFRTAEHGSFVQGVSYDPLGVYIASMGSDRTVRVYPRKTPPKAKKKVLRPANATEGSTSNVVTPPQEHQRMVTQLLMESKLEFGKTKRIKQRLISTIEVDGPAENDVQHQATQERQVKQTLFVDESNCESFFRRLSWTSDGAFLVTPAALWHARKDAERPSQPSNTADDDSRGSPSFSTYMFARHKFEEPYRVLAGLEKPSVVVRPNPVLFELPPSAVEDAKENHSPMELEHHDHSLPFCGLPYRSIFAVLTLDSVLIYDTHHLQPLSVVQGLHYAGLTDCCWSQDGMNLMISSSDGYISIVNFAEEELGEVYTRAKQTVLSIPVESAINDQEQVPDIFQPISAPQLPPCESGPANIVMAPAPKRAKKMRITPTLVSTMPSGALIKDCPAVTSPDAASAVVANVSCAPKRGISDIETDTVGAAVNKLSLDAAAFASTKSTELSKSDDAHNDIASEGKPRRKKKRLQPLLISSLN